MPVFDSRLCSGSRTDHWLPHQAASLTAAAVVLREADSKHQWCIVVAHADQQFIINCDICEKKTTTTRMRYLSFNIIDTFPMYNRGIELQSVVSDSIANDVR